MTGNYNPCTCWSINHLLRAISSLRSFLVQAQTKLTGQEDPQATFLYEYLPQVTDLNSSHQHPTTQPISPDPRTRVNAPRNHQSNPGAHCLKAALSALVKVQECNKSNTGLALTVGGGKPSEIAGVQKFWQRDAIAAGITGILRTAAVETPASTWIVSQIDSHQPKARTFSSASHSSKKAVYRLRLGFFSMHRQPFENFTAQSNKHELYP